MSDKKKLQLGMNPGTASQRLVKDLLWNFIKTTGKENCCKCGESMTRDTFSIEHVIPWLDSINPIELYFDIENIGYSHLKCNITDIRRRKAVCGTVWKYGKGCRCEPCKLARRERSKLDYKNRKDRN